MISAIAFDGFLWLVISLVPFLFVQRWLHRELQALLLLITRRQGLSLGLFSLFFFPGVLLHESSHYVMARVLGVKTGRFSLLPELTENGKLRMGYVETEQAGALADALIGTAPLLAGGGSDCYFGQCVPGAVAAGGVYACGGMGAFLAGTAGCP